MIKIWENVTRVWTRDHETTSMKMSSSIFRYVKKS